MRILYIYIYIPQNSIILKLERVLKIPFLSIAEYNTVIRKVRKREHQNPEFGHKQGEIQNKPAKKYISIQGGSFTLYFFFPERLHCCYIIFTAPTCTGIIKPLESCVH